ncbi:hypothetical protein YUWDRAFT_07029, partial [Streptomyces sp. AmelKG-D3]
MERGSATQAAKPETSASTPQLMSTGRGREGEPQVNTELLQRCRSSVRMALAIDVMRLGLHRDLRKIR